MPNRSSQRDFHALFQGAHGLAIGVAGIAALVIFRRPEEHGDQIAMFIAWCIAAGIAWGGFYLVRHGWQRRVYRSILRWGLTIPLSLVWLMIILVLSLALYIRTTGNVPGFIDGHFGLHVVGKGPAALNTSHTTAVGWKRQDDETFTRGSQVASVEAYDSKGWWPKQASKRGPWLAERFEESKGDWKPIGAIETRRLAPISGYQVWRQRMHGSFEGNKAMVNNYIIVDTKHDRMWNVAFGTATPVRNNAVIQSRFIAQVIKTTPV